MDLNSTYILLCGIIILLSKFSGSECRAWIDVEYIGYTKAFLTSLCERLFDFAKWMKDKIQIKKRNNDEW